MCEVSRTTGRRYFSAEDATALDPITREIDRFERTPVRVRTYVNYSELFRWPLALALAALAAEMVLLAWRGPLP